MALNSCRYRRYCRISVHCLGNRCFAHIRTKAGQGNLRLPSAIQVRANRKEGFITQTYDNHDHHPHKTPNEDKTAP